MKRLVMLSMFMLLSLTALAQPEAKPAGSSHPKNIAEKLPGKTELTWWGHAAFIVRTPGGATIAIDPWLHNPKAPADAKMPDALDAILVTHGHFDHVGDTAELAKKTGAQVVGSFELVTLIAPAKGEGGNVGGTLKIKDATIHMVPAVHSSGYGGMGSKELAYGGSAMGYVISIDHGPTFYHAGDTGVFSDMSLIADMFHPTFALLPIGGHFTMDPEAAARATKLLKVKTVIPMHFGTFPMLTGTPAELSAFLKKSGSAAKVLELTPGKAISL